MGNNLRKTVDALCPGIDEQIREEFFSRMDLEYFSLFSPKEIAGHLKMSGCLTPEHLVEAEITPAPDGLLNIAIVAYDYFSGFSIICGLLTSFGLDIQSGYIFTFSDRHTAEPVQEAGSPVLTKNRKKIVDWFRVSLLKGFKFGQNIQNQFQNELQKLLQQLDQNQLFEARAHINRRVVEHLSATKEAFSGHMYPVKVKFDNRLSKKWTVMEIVSKNTPAFLYAFSNALSLQGVYIYKVRIESLGKKAHDQIYVSDSHQKKLRRKKDLERLKMATVLTKQFTHFLASAPDPAKGIQYFDQLVEKVMKKGVSSSIFSFLKRRETLDLLARFFGTSEFLWEDFLRMQFENLLPILKNFKKEPLQKKKEVSRRELKKLLSGGQSLSEQKKILNDYKDRELFRIDMKHLVSPKIDLIRFSRDLSELAEVVIEQAYRLCNRHLAKKYGLPLLENDKTCPFAVCGLGKFGGRELGYASDIELLL